MPNSKLVDKTYDVPEIYQPYLGPSVTYPNLKMRKTRLNQDKAAERFDDFNQKGGENLLKWIEDILKTDRDAIYNVKKIGMETGRENQFIKSHDKDSKNANPTGVGGVPKLGNGSISRKIMTNKEVYNEGLQKEIKDIMYLIEYMSNTKPKI